MDQPLQHGAEVNLRLPALIPDDYLPDVHNRLIIYKRISAADSEHKLIELKVEPIDRFGTLPEPVKYLFQVTQIKLNAEALGINKIDAGPKSGRIEFGPEPKVNALSIVKLVQNQPQAYKLEGADRLKYTLPMDQPDQRIAATEAVLDTLSAEHQ